MPTPLEDPARGYLSASCTFEPDAALQDRHAAFSEKVLLTQGFVARNQHGHTVLLGRGGSDTSAAYLAALFQAERCEIWTDVPGLYTANPRLIPDARLLWPSATTRLRKLRPWARRFCIRDVSPPYESTRSHSSYAAHPILIFRILASQKKARQAAHR